MSLIKKLLATIVYITLCSILGGIIYLGIDKPISEWFIVILLLVFLLIIINGVFALYIFFSNRSDVRKKVWLLAFSLVPFISPFMFMWYGYNPFSKKHLVNFNKKFYANINDKKILETDNIIFDNLQKLLLNDSFYNPTNGKITRINETEEFYFEIIKLIRSAKKRIVLNYFILADGNFFKSIVNELKIKKDQGIEIYFAYDWVWTIKRFKNRILKKVVKELSLSIFKPKRFILASKHNNRNHKKYIIVDGIKAIYGGANLADEYINQNSNYNYWLDINFILEGDIASQLEKTFLFDINLCAFPKLMFDTKCSNNNIVDKNQTLFYLWDSYPENYLTTCFNVYKNIIPFVKNELIISTPYLYPTKELMDLFVNIIKMGVKVKFLLPKLPDNKKLIVWLNRALYKEFFDLGCEIYETNSFNHSKYWIIDDDLTIATSVNLDPRATIINYETSILIKDKMLNKEMKNEFNKIKNLSFKIESSFFENKKNKWKLFLIKKIMMCIELIL